MSKVSEIPATQRQSAVMANERLNTRPTFTVACWLLALIAFAQLITVGTALTVRSGQSAKVVAVDAPERKREVISAPEQPIQPRSIDEILADVGDGNATVSYSAQQPMIAEPPVQPKPPIPATSLPSSSNNQYAVIADPRVERLVQESRSLQLEDDMMRAMLKLDEAGRIDPNEPAVMYHKAMLFEEMGILAKAAEHYQQIQQMGISAGNYYRLAAAKLIKGMGRDIQKNDLVIGHLKTRKARGPLVGRHADVSITLIARPDRVIDANDVEVNVHFYDRVNGGEIRKADPTSDITNAWTDTEVNWQEVGNEETLSVTYTIPEADITDVHLLGRREFYGYVVELVYKGEVIDQQAQPRRLHSIHGGQARLNGDFLGGPLNDLPLGIPDDGGGLLPGLDGGYGDNPRLLPLPTR